MTTVTQQSSGESSSSSLLKTMAPSSSTLSSSSSSALALASKSLRKQLGSQLNESAAAPTSNFAKQQLLNMGWTPGTGLGKKRDGMKTHIKVKKREEQTGLGTERANQEARAVAETWWKDSIGDTLAKLSSSTSSKSKKDKTKKRKKEYTDEELFEATGGMRFGMRAGITKNLAKWRRTDDGIATSSSISAPTTVEEKVAEKTVKVTKVESDGEESDETVTDVRVVSDDNLSSSDEIIKKAEKEKKRKKDKKQKKSKKDKKDKGSKKKRNDKS